MLLVEARTELQQTHAGGEGYLQTCVCVRAACRTWYGLQSERREALARARRPGRGARLLRLRRNAALAGALLRPMGAS